MLYQSVWKRLVVSLGYTPCPGAMDVVSIFYKR